RLGWKTLAVNLSDLAAMGATARWVTLAGALPVVDETWLAAFAQGFFACAQTYGVELVGGDTTAGPLNLCLTALGEIEPGQALRRSGAQAGDEIWVSGRPGLAALGLAHLQGRIKLPEPWPRLCLAALEKPQPRLALGAALRGVAHAAIDISDGLLADLAHIARASGLTATLQLVQLPALGDLAGRGAHYDADLRRLALECQLTGGDDYELLFTAPLAAHNRVAEIAAQLELPLWCIGSMSAAEGAADVGSAVCVLDPEGQIVEFARQGYEHFAA
ncbi:thiamine-phosphate kinase, partial [Azonexus sp.]|uniref:thiamine-phosphate kinase n=1 Tax=Azonexus sp. TaxID=1872668 RepID=UPI0039E6EB2E